ncbi:MAG: helicase HerA-like domain-containing protein [Thermoanaerobaculia bacterium]
MGNDLFLGRSVTKAPAPLSLDRDDLTTHGLIVGMTGSGKTALGIVLIEELLKQGIPVLAIDPKGDIGNLALAFPRLAPEEFAPWLPAGGEATAEGEAKKWSEGLAGWGLSASDVASYAASRAVTIFTPGSTSGVQVDLLGALAPPPDGPESEEGRDLMTAFLCGLLGLLGRDADPVSSREFILLARCVEEIWGRGETATLESLVGAAAQPPFSAIGALPLETFFPKKERDGLVLALNGLLASPATAAFRGGVPLDVDALLGGGKPARLSIFSIAHLSDPERLFVVATLLSRVRSWLRSQPGSTTLRALIYIDEIFGFFPPSGEPPTKKPLLSLLKQARAFGVGTVLATQNPVDLDYKGLANCGCWWVGTLQTERDRRRLADGLTDAAGLTDVDALLNQTKKRVFLLHDVHRKAPELFETRWAMSYLRGPMTRDELAKLKKSAPAGAAPSAAPPAAAKPATPAGPPMLPADWPARWLDRRGGDRATPYLWVKAAVRYKSGKGTSDEITETKLFPLEAETPREVVQGDALGLEGKELLSAPPRPLSYGDLPSWLGTKGVKEAEKALKERLPDLLATTLLRDPLSGILSNPGESEDDFAARVGEKAKPSAALLERIEKKKRDLAAAEQAEKARSMETMASIGTAALDVLGGLFGSRKSLKVGKVGSVLSKKRMEDAAETKIETLKAELAELEAKVAAPDPARFEKVDVVPTKTGVDILGVGVAWVS